MSCNFGCWFRRNSKSFEREWSPYKCHVLHEVDTWSIAKTNQYTGRNVFLDKIFQLFYYFLFISSIIYYNLWLFLGVDRRYEYWSSFGESKRNTRQRIKRFTTWWCWRRNLQLCQWKQFICYVTWDCSFWSVGWLLSEIAKNE